MLKASHLPQAWSGKNAWRILETDFSHGAHFFETWQAWRADTQRPRMLHFVSFTATPPSRDALLASLAQHPQYTALITELATHWFGLLPGFHRLMLNEGHVLLTLCVGEMTSLLREQQYAADSIYLSFSNSMDAVDCGWTPWTAKALARCCRRGTRLATFSSSKGLQAHLTQSGFELSPDRSGKMPYALSGTFNPAWTLKNSRNPKKEVATVGTCAVIGAGLAGASVAAALAQRGWRVRVLDAASLPAQGASGLPVGLVVTHASVDDCALSRLTRSGVRLMRQQAQRLLKQGQDWDACGTFERRLDASPGIPHDGPAWGQDWIKENTPFIWHAQAAWLKPAQMVRAWLAQPGITWIGNAQVASLRKSAMEWELLDASGHVLACADRVVFANAGGALPLLQSIEAAQPELALKINQLPGMHGVRGQLSWDTHGSAPAAPFPRCPVNGAGSVIPGIPTEQGDAWFIGSSYQAVDRLASSTQSCHEENWGRLDKLLPDLGQALADKFMQGPLRTWQGTRCVTADRLPAVGPLDLTGGATLWICAGMGSRGLTFSVLCAEILAATWGDEPLPIDTGLARLLYSLRSKAACGLN